MEHLKEKPLIIRVDASTQIGTGHLMRCLALAQAWKDSGGEGSFITACNNKGLLERLREEGFSIHLIDRAYPDPYDWEVTKGILHNHPDAWVVLDGYHFDKVYQQQVKGAGHRLLVIDDMAHLKHYYADIVLNQNIHAEQLRYSCEPYTRLLLGTRYVLLRREFLAWRNWKREIPEAARRVLVTLGGGDPENHTLKVIQALQKVDIPGVEAIVVIGASNPHTDLVEAAIGQSRIPIRLICNASNMPELMAWADVAVSAAGSTTWELLFLGMPAMFFILADNQRYVAEQMDSQEIGKSLGWAGDISVEPLAKTIALLLKDLDLRAKISEKARQIIDGRGVQRVITVMQETRADRLKLRPATLDDRRALWDWRNDTITRRNSFDSRIIPKEEHDLWFHKAMSDPGRCLVIGLDEYNEKVGVVRFDIRSKEVAEIDVNLAPKKRGLGLGAKLIAQSVNHYLAKFNQMTRITARIKEHNVASLKAFEKAGFVFKERFNGGGGNLRVSAWRAPR